MTGLTNGSPAIRSERTCPPLARSRKPANNGGPTQTVALLPGSPAIGKGTNVSGITTDQRGSLARPVPHIGAYQTLGIGEQPATSDGVCQYDSNILGQFAAARNKQRAVDAKHRWRDWTSITGATSSSYDFTANTSENGLEYEAVFTTAYGTFTSNPATLTVLASSAVTLRSAPQGETLNSPAFQAVTTPLPAIGTPVFGVDSLNFTVTVPSPGATATVVIQLPAGLLNPNTPYTYFKLNSSGTWQAFPQAVINAATDQITLTLTDGGAAATRTASPMAPSSIQRPDCRSGGYDGLGFCGAFWNVVARCRRARQSRRALPAFRKQSHLLQAWRAAPSLCSRDRWS